MRARPFIAILEPENLAIVGYAAVLFLVCAVAVWAIERFEG
jgi:hypothetical protein